MLNDFVGFRLAQLRFQAGLGFLEWYYTFLLDLSIFMMQGKVRLKTDAVDSTYRYSIPGLGRSNGSRSRPPLEHNTGGGSRLGRTSNIECHSRYPSFDSSGRCSTVGDPLCKARCRSRSRAPCTRVRNKFRRSTPQTGSSTSCRIEPGRRGTRVATARDHGKPSLNPSKLRCPHPTCSRPAVALGGVE